MTGIDIVKKGEKSNFSILAPIFQKRTKSPDGAKRKIPSRLLTTAQGVFDISQTDGAPLPTLVHQLRGNPGKALVKATSVRKASQDRGGQVRGYSERLKALASFGGKIVLRPDLDSAREFGVLSP